MMQQALQLSFSDQLVQIIPEVPAVLRGMSVVLVVLAIKVLVSLRGFSRHLIQLSKVRFALDFLQHLMHRFSGDSLDVLRIGCLRLPREVSPRATVDVSVRLEIPLFLRDNLLFSFALHLVFFYSFIVIDPIHQLVHAGGRLTSQGFP